MGFVRNEARRSLAAVHSHFREADKSRLKRGLLNDLMSQIPFAGGSAYLIFQALQGNLSAGACLAGITAVGAMQASVKSILAQVTHIMGQASRLKRLFDVAPYSSHKPQEQDDSAEDAAAISTIKRVPTLALTGVSFRYPASKRTVLKNVNLEIKPGEVVAIVGANGAGKSTLIRLLTGERTPTEGTRSVGGRTLEEVGLEQWSEAIGVMSQSPTRMEGFTIRQNIEIGQGRERGLSAEEAADIVGAAAMIEKLEARSDLAPEGVVKGYDCVLSTAFPGGVDPSGGQFQLIAAARAVARDPQVLILDEPTSSLDPINEVTLLHRLKERFSGRTIILVTHRFGTVAEADKIVVLEKGSISGCGAHEELMQNNPTYRRLFLAPAAPILRGVRSELRQAGFEHLFSEAENAEQQARSGGL